MFPSLYLVILLGQFTETPPPPNQDVAKVTKSGDQGALEWMDAEDRVSGNFSPYEPKSGGTVDVVVRVGTFQGAEWSGPVTLTLKGPGGGPGESHVATMNAKSKAWTAQMKAGDEGPYTLEVGFAITRHKVVRATINVVQAPLHRWPWYVIIALFGGLALFFGVRAVIGKKTA